MRILIDLCHPAHVHFFKYAIYHWLGLGFEVLLTARDKDVTLRLLDHYGLDYQPLTSTSHGTYGLVSEFIKHEWKLIRIILKFRPDTVTAIGGIFIAPICKLMGIPSVVFTDSEHVFFDKFLTYPLASIVCTPFCFKRKIGNNQLYYQGFQELAYLYPDRFKADPETLKMCNLSPNERYALLRFVSWGASHDIGQSGFSTEEKLYLVQELSKRGRVLLSSEGELPRELKKYAISIPPEKIHDLLFFASLYVGEGATMATEAGLLGTPAVYVSSLVGTMGNYDELARYGLVESYQNGRVGIQRAIRIMDNFNAKSRWQKKREKMLENLIDVTTFITSTVESFGRGGKKRWIF